MVICDEDATGWMRGKGSGDNSLLSASFRGVENGFETGWICSKREILLPLFLTGEKGLVDVTGGSTFTAFVFEINSFDSRLGGVDGCVLALFNFLYSLYFSAEGMKSSTASTVPIVRTAPISGRSLMSCIIGSLPLSALKSRSQALISVRRATASMAVVGDNDRRAESDAERRNEKGPGRVERDAQRLEENGRLSLSLFWFPLIVPFFT